MTRLEILAHSTVYGNPTPNRTSEYVSFPAIQALPDDVLLCMCRHGSARESDDGVVRIQRSTDGGVNWDPAGELPEPAGAGDGSRLPGGFGVTPGGETLAWARYAPGRNGESGQLVWRSSDGGLTWSEPAEVPLIEVPIQLPQLPNFGHCCVVGGGSRWPHLCYYLTADSKALLSYLHLIGTTSDGPLLSLYCERRGHRLYLVELHARTRMLGCGLRKLHSRPSPISSLFSERRLHVFNLRSSSFFQKDACMSSLDIDRARTCPWPLRRRRP